MQRLRKTLGPFRLEWVSADEVYNMGKGMTMRGQKVHWNFVVHLQGLVGALFILRVMRDEGILLQRSNAIKYVL